MGNIIISTVRSMWVIGGRERIWEVRIIFWVRDEGLSCEVIVEVERGNRYE